MKQFLKEHSYDMVKMFLNQFAIAVFGFSLAMAAGQAENPTLRNVTGVFAILFYLFLLYITAWEIGYRDKIGVETGRKKKQTWKGVWISLCANSLNFLFAILITLAQFCNVSVLNQIGGVASFFALFLEGMYTGLLANSVGGVVLNSCWFVYFLLPLPAILTCGGAYWLGLHDVKYSSIFNKQEYPASDRAPKQKKDDRQN